MATETKEIRFDEEVVPLIKKYLAEIQYGNITLVIQDGKVIQVERHEKVRLK